MCHFAKQTRMLPSFDKLLRIPAAKNRLSIPPNGDNALFQRAACLAAQLSGITLLHVGSGYTADMRVAAFRRRVCFCEDSMPITADHLHCTYDWTAYAAE